MNARVVGISFDRVEDNKVWAEKMDFPFTLLSDPDRSIGALLGARRSRNHPLSFMPRRITYLIDPGGVVHRVYEVGRDIEGHAQQVLDEIKAAQAAENGA